MPFFQDDDEASQSDKSPKKTGWSGMQVCLMDKKKDISSKMKDDTILDNGVERISLGSLRQSLKITVVTLTDPHVILRWLWCAY